jgi:putative acetyltransferase
MIIRLEQPDDIKGICDINEKAFGRTQEANIIDNLRKNCEEMLSLVAVEEEKIVGHILFSPVIIEGCPMGSFFPFTNSLIFPYVKCVDLTLMTNDSFRV